MGFHLEQAYRWRAELGPVDAHGRELARRAGEALTRAGRSALRAGDAPATVHLLERALSLLGPQDPLRSQLIPDLAGAIFVVGELDPGDVLVAEAIESARLSGAQGPKWHAILARDRVDLYGDPDRADLDEIAANAHQALAAFGELGDDQGLSRAWAVLGDVEWMRGRVASAGSGAQKAADHARRAGSRFEEMFALTYMGWSLVDGPASVEDGVHGCQELLHRAEGNPGAEAELLCHLGVLEAMLGRFSEAREHAAAGLSLTKGIGWRETLGVQQILSGEVELLAGDPVSAEERMREAVDVLTEVGDLWFLSTVAVRLPRAVYAQGRYAGRVRADGEAPAAGTREPGHGVADPPPKSASEAARAARIAGRGGHARSGGGQPGPADRLPQLPRRGTSRPRRGSHSRREGAGIARIAQAGARALRAQGKPRGRRRVRA